MSEKIASSIFCRHSTIIYLALGLLVPGCFGRGRPSYQPGMGCKAASFEQVRYYIRPGISTKADIKTIIGEPLRVSAADSGRQIWTYYYYQCQCRGGFIWALQGVYDTRYDLVSVDFDGDGVVETAYFSNISDEIPPVKTRTPGARLLPGPKPSRRDQVVKRGMTSPYLPTPLAPTPGKRRFFLRGKSPLPEEQVAILTALGDAWIHVVDMQEVLAMTTAVELLPGRHLIDVYYYAVDVIADYVRWEWLGRDFTGQVDAKPGRRYTISIEGEWEERGKGLFRAVIRDVTDDQPAREGKPLK